MINGSQSNIERKQKSFGHQRQDDATGREAVCGGQAAVLGGLLHGGARKGLQATQEHAGPRQAVLQVRKSKKMFFPVTVIITL